MRYALLNQDDTVISIVSGNKPSEDWVDYPTEAPAMSLAKIKRTGEGVFIQTPDSWLPTPSYDVQRFHAYPSMGEQLGALWKALAPLIVHEEALKVLADIQEVKQTYPKPVA